MLLDVLIVADSAAIREILQRVLKQAGVPLGEVYEAAGGKAMAAGELGAAGCIRKPFTDLLAVDSPAGPEGVNGGVLDAVAV